MCDIASIIQSQVDFMGDIFSSDQTKAIDKNRFLKTWIV